MCRQVRTIIMHETVSRAYSILYHNEVIEITRWVPQGCLLDADPQQSCKQSSHNQRQRPPSSLCTFCNSDRWCLCCSVSHGCALHYRLLERWSQCSKLQLLLQPLQ